MPPPSQLFLHYLSRLKDLLHRIDVVDATIAGKRLHPDMFPLLQQARTAVGFTLRASCPLAGRDIVSFTLGECTLPNVLSEIDATVDYLSSLREADFSDIDTRRIRTVAGFAELEMSGGDYYLMYAVPNFFFHYSMVYAIARQAGVPVGKADFDGYHVYPPGFSFKA